ncbi:LexA family protein [Micromonospora sediminicola]|uniref:LexA family protein n=1 Tax=Micromonospora sediminicola TaxID=946078 RepID=UPI00378F7922
MPDPTCRPPLTVREERLLDALRRHLADHGDMPTAAQLAAAVGSRSEDRVRESLGALVLKGYIRRDDTRAGGIEIVQVAS